MSITSDEVNFLVYRYLLESGNRFSFLLCIQQKYIWGSKYSTVYAECCCDILFHSQSFNILPRFPALCLHVWSGGSRAPVQYQRLCHSSRSPHCRPAEGAAVCGGRSQHCRGTHMYCVCCDNVWRNMCVTVHVLQWLYWWSVFVAKTRGP